MATKVATSGPVRAPGNRGVISNHKLVGGTAPRPRRAPSAAGQASAPADRSSGPAPTSVGPENLRGLPAQEKHLENVDSRLEQSYNDILSGKKTSFSDDRMDLMKQALFEETRAQARTSEQKAIAQAALTGGARSGGLQRRFDEIDRSMRSDYTRGVRDLLIEKEKAQFEDYKFALQGMGQWLTQKRQYMIGKQQVAATIESARIGAAAQVAAAGIAADATKAAARMSAGASRAASKESARQFDANLEFQREQFNHQKAVDEFNMCRATGTCP